MLSCQRLKTTVRHIVQMIGTRYFKARNERIGTGVLVMSVERKVRECDSCSFNHGSGLGQKAQSSSPAPKAQTHTDGRNPRNVLVSEERVVLD